MRRSVLMVCLLQWMVLCAHARYLDPGTNYALNRFIVRTWPESRNLSPVSDGKIAVLADRQLTELNQKWGVGEVERLFPAVSTREELHSLELSCYWRFWLRDGAISEEMLEDFSYASAVEFVEAVPICEVCFQPNDPAYANQWYLHATEQDHDIDAPEAWNLQRGHANAIIGLMDTGVQFGHPDLAANIWVNEVEMNGAPNFDDDSNGYRDDFYGWDFIVYEMAWPGEDYRYPDNSPTDFVGHGTHVAGIAAAALHNGTGVSGIAGGGSGYEGARIMPLRIGWLGADGHGYVAMDYAAQAIEYGRQKGVTVFSCAWTSSYHSALVTAVNNAINDGIVFCVAAGNSNNSTPFYLNSRGDCMDIAATDANDVRTSNSNYGTWVDICAPGQNIYSTYSNHYTNTYAYNSGTSMASAMVTGAVALLKSHRPDWTRDQITCAVLAGIDDIYEENPGFVGLLGSGRLNLHLALLNAGAYTILSPNGGEIWTVGDTVKVTWKNDGMDGGIVLSLNRNFPEGEWEEIFAGVPEGDLLRLVVPEPACACARIRIQSQSVPDVADSSDGNFAIVDIPEITAFPRRRDIILRWTPTGALRYNIYSSPGHFGSFWHLEGTTVDTFHVDIGAAASQSRRFYQVRGVSDSP
ncbi:MAG: S8 family serine peptidase [bacterium]